MMVKSLSWKVILALQFITFTITPAVSLLFYYGPSIQSLVATTSNLNDASDGTRGFQKITGKTINLADYAPLYTVLVPFIPDKSFANRTEAVQYFKGLHDTEFYVEAPVGYGVMAVIQILRVFTISGDPTHCMDSLIFREVPRNSSSDQATAQLNFSSKVCGQIDEDDFSLHPKGLVGNLSFIAKSGKMAVELLLVSTLLQGRWVDQNPRKHVEVVMAIEISFTAFPLKTKIVTTAPKTIPLTETSNGTYSTESQYLSVPHSPIPFRGKSNFAQCLVDTETQDPVVTLLPCLDNDDDTNEFGSTICIPSQLFCDDIIQCAFSDSDSVFAQDESFCPPTKTTGAKNNENLSPILFNENYFNVINGSRFNPPIVMEENDATIKVVTGFVGLVCCLFGMALTVAMVWWVLKCQRNFCSAQTPQCGLSHSDPNHHHENIMHSLPYNLTVAEYIDHYYPKRNVDAHGAKIDSKV